MSAGFCGGCGSERLMTDQEYCGSCGKRFRSETQNAPKKPRGWPERFRSIGGVIAVVLGCTILVAIAALPLVPLVGWMMSSDKSSAEPADSTDTAVEQLPESHLTVFQVLGRETWCDLQESERDDGPLTGGSDNSALGETYLISKRVSFR